MEIAYEEGWLLGTRSDQRTYLPIVFVDIDYKRPDFELHLRRVEKERPKYAIVPDLSDTVLDPNDIERALHQAQQLQQYCQIPFIVPKLEEQLSYIPHNYAIAYSIPSTYGGARFPIERLVGRRVHLLGGSPDKQFACWQRATSAGVAIISADGNGAQGAAVKWMKYWEDRPQGAKWIKMPKSEGTYYDCWRLSCRNIRRKWLELQGCMCLGE